MDKPIIEIKNISKKYNIAHRSGKYVTLRDILTNIIKKPFSFAKRRVKKILGRETIGEFWALKNVSLSVSRGDVVGVIGKNGAGKSTLLKILTGITPPTEGEIILRGKVSSLLEVGTGFHPELTGRENIYLNGAILGMTRKEIKSKFDEIVDFAGIEKFLDTPVKRYSSGMYVRLAFSVAAHLEPDILLVDEVLAVGDAEFQQKCLGKMDEVTKTAGRTILFVSHNMSAIERLCKKTILLDKGQIVDIGETKDIINKYTHIVQKNTDTNVKFPLVSKDIIISDFSIQQEKRGSDLFSGDDPFDVKIDFKIINKIHSSLRIGFHIKNQFGYSIINSYLSDWHQELDGMEPGNYSAVLRFPEKFLKEGQYSFCLEAYRFGVEDYFTKDNICKIVNVASPSGFTTTKTKNSFAPLVIIDQPWQVIKK